jgi:hypothetical protein
MTAQLVDLTARRRQADRAVARVASAPVRYVPEAFLLALECRDAGDGQQRTWRLAPVTPLRPVAAAR